MNGQVSPLAASPAPLMDAPVQHMPSALPIQEVPPPSVEDNPVLGAAMRRVQGGLFIMPDR